MIEKIANRYKVISLIGQGGMADVYKAHDTILNRTVAVKVLREKLSQDPMTLVRFQREASAASRMSHPNVVDIYDVGEYENLHYIVMEYVKGRTLKELISYRGALDVYETINIMIQLTSAVCEAHRNQIIHRDIKPQNVLVKDDGTIKITDFGIAIAGDAVQLTMNNAVMGSAHYLAPETAQGKEPNAQVDIYSLGIVLFELLTGFVPFRGKTPTEIAVKHLTEPVPYVRDLNSGIPQSVENIIIKATAKDCEKRYQAAAEMLYELKHCFDMERRFDERIIYEVKPIKKVKVVDGKVLIEYGEIEKENKFNYKKFLNILISAAIVVIVSILLFLILTMTGVIRINGVMGYVTMPNLVNVSKEVCIDMLKEAEFDTNNVTFEEEVSDSVEKGHVISTNIKHDEIVKKNSPIVIKVCKGPTFLIEDYKNQYLNVLQETLQQAGLHLKYDIEYRNAADTEPGVILEQSILKPGTRIDPDKELTIHLVVSQYPQLVIPEDWIGQDVDQLIDALHQQGIAVVKKPYARITSGENKVVAVYPEVGTLYIQEGTNSVITLIYN
ncbi:MAG: Stk1 family PASTA domain-containing Ser/Thr kinase [Firmicutes bacterium]|nr:Stk1 family PASTA domain-containing Ser/Thr kinase [Bacillota bacterium]